MTETKRSCVTLIFCVPSSAVVLNWWSLTAKIISPHHQRANLFYKNENASRRSVMSSHYIMGVIELIVCPVKERSKYFSINIFLNPFWKWSPRGPPVERLWPNAPVTKPEYYFRNVYIKLHRAKIWVEDTPRWTFEQMPKKKTLKNFGYNLFTNKFTLCPFWNAHVNTETGK